MVAEGITGGNEQEGINKDAFGTDDIWVVLALTEGSRDIVIKEIDLQVGERDSQIVDCNQEFGPCLSEHNVGFNMKEASNTSQSFCPV